jgi:hypothetical protein
MVQKKKKKRKTHTPARAPAASWEEGIGTGTISRTLWSLSPYLSLSQRILMQVTRTSTLELHLVRYLLGLQDSLLFVFCQKPGFQTTLSHVNPLPITQIFKEEKSEISFDTNTPTTHSPHISGFHPNKNQNLSSKPKSFL